MTEQEAFGYNNFNTVEYVRSVSVNITDPFPLLSPDDKRLRDTLETIRVVPKFVTASTTALAYVSLIERIWKESAANQSCVNLLNRYAFRNKLDVRYDITPDFLFESENEPSISDKNAFVQALKDLGIRIPQIKKISEDINANYQCHGDAFVLCRIVNVGGKWDISFNHISPEQFSYVDKNEQSRNELGQLIEGIWAKIWDSETLSNEKNYRYVYVTNIGSEIVNWKEIDENSYETVFHWKNGDDSDLYGKVGIESIKYDLYIEAKRKQTIAKVEQSFLTAQFIYASSLPEYGKYMMTNEKGEGVDPSKAAQMLVQKEKEQLNKLATAEGRTPSELLLMKYMPNDKPQLMKLEISRDTEYSKHVVSLSRGNILAFHGTTEDMVGFEQTRRALGDNAVMDNIIRYIETVVKPAQLQIESFWSYIFTEIGKVTDTPILVETTIKFEDKSVQLLEYAKQTETTQV